MAQQSRAFDQIKAILGRMDRSIDEARTKRLNPEDEPAEQTPHEAPSRPSPQKPPLPPAPGDVRRAGASQYGRARPLRREGDDQGTWRGN